MAKRFTATEKWIDPWFCGLTALDKLFWVYLLDNCDHAGIWQVNWPLVGFHIKDYVFNKEVFKGRIVELKEQKWFMPKFIEFQYGRLRNNNSTHISVLKILEDNNLLNYAKGDGRLLLKDDKVDEKLRQEVFKECNGLCVYCGNVLSDEFEIDHITPTIKGGETKKSNLVSCCSECNRFKSDYSLEEFINRRG